MSDQPFITRERALEVLDYNPNTGVFKWRTSPVGWIAAGSVAGTASHGYRYIKVDQRRYEAHRLAWLVVYGAWPLGEIDHINCQRDDNRISNLRQAYGSGNRWNRGASANNTTGYKGVFRIGSSGRFCARLGKHNKVKHLGCFATAAEAHAAYCATAAELHGEFANTG
jgi:HNH endonuclease/AP2 domain